jgi:hypothetical protein
LLLSFIFTPLLSLVRRWVNRWLNIQEFHPSRTLHAYSEQISNILDMQRLANVAVGLIIEAMDISRGFLFLVDSELTSDAQKVYRLRAVRNQGERQVKIVTRNSARSFNMTSTCSPPTDLFLPPSVSGSITSKQKCISPSLANANGSDCLPSGPRSAASAIQRKTW